MEPQADDPDQQSLDRLELFLRAVTRAGVVAGLLTPVVYAQVTWFAFISLKVFWLQAVVGLTLPAYIVLALRRPEYRPPRTWVALALLAQLVGVALSVAFASDPSRAWWGALDRMDGLWSLLHFAGWTLMTAGVARTWRDWSRLLHVEIVVGLLAGCVAILQIPFPSILGQPTDVRISGVFGNPIFSGAYHALIVFMTALVWVREQRPSRGRQALYVVSMTTSLVVLALAGSRGPLLGLASGLAVTVLVRALLGRGRKAVLRGVVALACATALYVAFAVLVAPRRELSAFWDRHPNFQHLFLLQDNAGRLDFWRLVLSGIREHPWFGWGQANFEALFDRHYVPFERCGPQGADNAHNFALQALATTGLIGLTGLLFLWGAVGAAFVRAHRRGALEALPTALLLGMAAGHLVQLLFNPESPGTFILCAFLIALGCWIERSSPTMPTPSRRKPGIATFVLAEMAGTAIVVVWTILPAYASEMALLAVTDYRHGKPAEAWRHARQAASVPTPYLEDQLSVDLQLLLSQVDNQALDRSFAWRDLFALDRMLAERYLAQHHTLRFRITYARLLTAIGMATGDQRLTDEGESRLRQALLDHPKRQELMFALGAVLGARGRLDEAEKLYRQALEEEPRIGESRFRLGRFLWRYRELPSQGATFVAEGTRGVCPYFGSSLDELAMVAGALAQQHDTQGLLAAIPLAYGLRPSPSPGPYVALASALERVGLLAERDRILRFGMKHAPDIARRAQPLLQGQAKTLAETEK